MYFSFCLIFCLSFFPCQKSFDLILLTKSEKKEKHPQSLQTLSPSNKKGFAKQKGIILKNEKQKFLKKRYSDVPQARVERATISSVSRCLRAIIVGV